mgnify:CR=1 FL=1
MLTLILFKRQFRSILMSIFVNSRSIFCLDWNERLVACNPNKMKDNKCQLVYKSLKKRAPKCREAEFCVHLHKTIYL